ncbi:MAG: alanine racemase, partial [Gemmatimonadota bacterium]
RDLTTVGPEAERSAPPGRAWIEVDLDALRRNAEALARAVAPARLIPMIKADAYGLGAVRAARALRAVEPYAFGVASADEGAALRRAGIGERIVVFSPCASIDGPALRRHALEPAVLGVEGLRALVGEGEPVADQALAGGAVTGGHLGGEPPAVHLEIDTGIGRAGLPAGAGWAGEIARVVAAGRLRVATTYSHLHSAESNPAATRSQLDRFREAVEVLRAAGLDPGPLHIANSAAAIAGPSYHLDLVRPGLYLYGGGRGWPRAVAPEPEPVVRVRARVLEVRSVDAGVTVSYGATYTTSAPARLATLGIGYADGVPLGLSNRGGAVVRGRRVPIRGAVCMDGTVVDVTEVRGVRAGDFATLLGSDGGEEIRLDELAESAGTIEHAVLTGLGRRLPRIYRDEGVDERETDTERSGARATGPDVADG